MDYLVTLVLARLREAQMLIALPGGLRAGDVNARAKSAKKRGQLMTEKLTTYDPAVALVDDEEITFFMADAFETVDSAFIAKALVVVARAKGMLGIVTDAELPSSLR